MYVLTVLSGGVPVVTKLLVCMSVCTVVLRAVFVSSLFLFYVLLFILIHTM